MIAPMLMFNIITIIFLFVSYDATPVWLRIVLFAIIFISSLIAYVSEDNLRDKIDDLENEVKNLKGGDRTGYHETKPKAIDAWNTRTQKEKGGEK